MSIKKKLFIVALLFQCLITFAQSACEPNQISTNPNFPENPLDPDYLNKFDWTTSNSNYKINSQCNPDTFTPNPFQANQLDLLPLSLSKDMKPEDGWEMIAYNLGYDNNNVPLAARPEHTYLMLYNKYTGTLRVLVKWCRNSNYNGALLTLSFAPGFQTNLLDMANDEKALETTHTSNPSLSTALKFYNDNNSWAYADFKMNYDPCTCSFNETSRLSLYTELISNSSVKLTGKISGTITSISNGQGASSSGGSFWKSANSINSKMMKAHKGVQSFADDYKKIYKKLDDAGVTVNAINSIGGFLNNNSFMKAGLKALPVIGEGVKFLSGLFGGGASGNQPIKLAPLSVNLDVKIEGSISTQDPMHNETIGLPGSSGSSILPGTSGGQPLYNETLGVFSLVKKPVIYFKDIIERKSFINRERETNIFTRQAKYFEFKNDYDFIKRNYKFSGEKIKYAINPASGLVLQDAEIILMVEYEKPGLIYNKALPNLANSNVDLNKDNGLNIIGTDKGPAINLNKAIFQNAFKPIGINNFKKDYSFSYLHEVKSMGANVKQLQYNQFATFNKWSCVTSGFFPSPCWNRAISYPFAYKQKNNELTDPFGTRLSPWDFKEVTAAGFLSSNFDIAPREEFLEARVKKFKLKFVLNLKRTDNPSAQNVLYVVTYPIELKKAPAGYNMSGSNYANDALAYKNQPNFNPNVPTNNIVAVSKQELGTICSSSSYRKNRTNSTFRSTISTNPIIENQPSLKPITYPVPVKNRLNIITNGFEIRSIVNLSNQVVKRIETGRRELFRRGRDGSRGEPSRRDRDGNRGEPSRISRDGEVAIDVSNLKKGIYFLKYLKKDRKLGSIKFVIE